MPNDALLSDHADVPMHFPLHDAIVKKKFKVQRCPDNAILEPKQYNAKRCYSFFFAAPFSAFALRLLIHALISLSRPMTSGTPTGPRSGR